MKDVCSECGSEEVVMWINGPRCENCPPHECERCGADLEQGDDEFWSWERRCEKCQNLLEKGVWCEQCDSELVISDWGYDGVKVACDCSSIHVPHDPFSLKAPYSWKINGRHGERNMRKL